MATTYTLISSNTLSSSAASVTFSSIPSTYTDLVLRVSARSDSTSAAYNLEINGDSSTIYSRVYLQGSGSGAGASGISTAQTSYPLGTIPTTASTSNTFSSGEFYIPNYSIVQQRQTGMISVQENNDASTNANIYATAGLYTGTTAITSLRVFKASGNFVSGSSFYLYGIKNS